MLEELAQFGNAAGHIRDVGLMVVQDGFKSLRNKAMKSEDLSDDEKGIELVNGLATILQ